MFVGVYYLAIPNKGIEANQYEGLKFFAYFQTLNALKL